ncbi:MAG: choice-of-anchor J domain-containing protein [Candidatus Cloacimonetes bacterium]|nr:choice-of-anchor J domain-containing protein [Candidatus Cloacimonadota bacterium]
MKKIILLFTLMLFTAISIFAQWDIDEGFEDGSIPGDWTIYDNDNDGYQWETYESSTNAHTGDYCAKVWVNLGPTAPNDDWLITPQISIQSGDSLVFWAKSEFEFNPENFNVKLSQTGIDIVNFNVTLESVIGASATYTKYAYDLSSYNGQNIYLAIQYIKFHGSNLFIDDVKVGKIPPPTYTEGFEGTWLPDGWSVINNNGGNEWGLLSHSTYSHNSDHCAKSQTDSGGNDDWLITPKVSVQHGNTLVFWARSWMNSFPENFNVKLSQTGNVLEDFTITLGAVTGVQATWVRYEYDLSDYVGENVYLAVQHVTNSGILLLVDDFTMPAISSTAPEVPENILITINGNDVELSWDTTATDYKVEYSTEPYNGYTELTSTTGGTTSYTHVGGALGTKHFYRIIALN